MPPERKPAGEADRFPCNEQVAEIVKSALELPRQDRQSFLDQECRSNPEMRAEIESLLEQEAPAEDLIETPALHLAAETFMREKSLREGEIVGGYKVLSLIDRGGMGEVYLAQDRQLHRKVALKLIRRGMDTEAIIRRFRNEERLLASLNHPNIAQLYGGGMTPEGLPFFAMELVEGERLDVYCREKYCQSGADRLSIFEQLELFRKICAAVSYAHQRLVVHRDLKPANIRVKAEGEPKLLDFGIAKLLKPEPASLDLTLTQPRVMTPEYASPEQVRGEPVTTATDVYSLGVILYELLTGQKPYRLKTRTPEEISRAITEQDPMRPSTAIARRDGSSKSQTPNPKLLRGDLDNIILKALRKEPERRYASVAQFSEDIRRHLEGRPVIARKDTVGYRAGKFVKRNKVGVAAAVVVVLALIAGMITTAWQARIATIERAKAEQRFNDVRHLADSLMFEIHDAIQNLAGSTPARRLLVSRALQYLDSLAHESHSNPAVQRELATAYEKLGDIQGNPYVPNLGDTQGALQSYTKALAIRQSLLLTSAGDETQEELAKSYRSLGDILEQKGDIAVCVESFRKSLAIFESLGKAHPSNRRLQEELARAYEALGDGLRRTDKLSEKLQDFRKSLAIRERLLAMTPNDRSLRRSVAVSLMKLGDAWAVNKAEAMDSLGKAVVIVESLAASDPMNARAQRDLGLIAYRFGEVLNSVGDYSGALEKYQKALAVHERLSEEDPKDIQARFDTASIRADIAEAFLNLNNSGQALENGSKSLSMFENLVETDPANMVYFRYLGLCYDLLGKTHTLVGSDAKLSTSNRIEQWQQARQLYQRALKVFSELRDNGTLRSTDKDRPVDLTTKIKACDTAIDELKRSNNPTG
jgi:tetratricopeptide (TPR) repeat protein/tRNA A-37 threonylcarbamoyl transferase component Bud32